MDPVKTENRGLLKLVESFISYVAPLRIGLVLAANSSTSANGLNDPGVALLCSYNYISQTKSPSTALNFLITVLGSTEEGVDDVTVEDVKTQLKKQFGEDAIDDVLGDDSDYDFGRQLSQDFVQRSGLRSLPQAMLNGIPLPAHHVNVDDFEEAVLQEVMSQTPGFQKAVYRGKLSDADDVIEYLMNQPNVMPRLNQRILDKEGAFYLDMSGTASSTTDLQKLMKVSPRDMTATAVENMKYFTVPRKGNKKYNTMTYWVVGDLECPKARELLLAALEHLVSV